MVEPVYIDSAENVLLCLENLAIRKRQESNSTGRYEEIGVVNNPGIMRDGITCKIQSGRECLYKLNRACPAELR